MKDKEKQKILILLSKCPDLKNSNAAKLKLYLARNNCSSISLPTINKYKKLLIDKKDFYDKQIGFYTNSYDKIIEEIIGELNRNKYKISKSSQYRKIIHNELIKYQKKYNLELTKNSIYFYEYNKILKKIRKDIYTNLYYIPQKTLNYLYNDEAKKLNLFPKKSNIPNTILNEIENSFKDGTLKKFVQSKSDNTKSTVKYIQIYIEKNYNVKLSCSQIHYYFFKYYKHWWIIEYFS